MRLRNAFFAIAVAAIALAALPASALEFHGYLRSGIGGNFRGGGQACFYLPNTDFHWRLGNECDTYAELQFSETLYKDRTGVTFDYVGMLSYQTPQGEYYQSLKNSGSDIAVRQNYISVNNLPFLGGASLWGGLRYYMRYNSDPIDWFYFTPSGPGAGIENVDMFGLFQAALAAFQSKYNQSNYRGPAGSQDPVPTSAKQVWRVDLRGYNIPFPVGDLLVALDLGILSAASGQQTPGSETISPEITVQHNWPIFGGYNRLTFQWGQGMMSPLSEYPAENASSKAYQWRIIEQLLIQPIPQFAGMFIFTYQDLNKVYENPVANPGNTSGVNWAGNSATTWTIGVRPVWNIVDYFKLQADFGYQSLTPKVAYQGTNPGGPYTNTDTRNMFKMSFAPTFAPLAGPGGSYYTRPELRLFVTYASWNKAAQVADNYQSGAMNQGTCAATGTSNSLFGCSTNGFTFGAQVEAWW